MTETTPTAPWSLELRRRAAELLVETLRRDPERAQAIAGGLAPDGRGPGWRYAQYGDSIDSPKREVAYQTAFPELGTFLAVLEAGDPGAIEIALRIVSELDAEAAVPVARVLLPGRPWRGLGRALGYALGRGASEESFALLLESPRAPYLRDGLASNRYPGGVSRAWAAYQAVGGLDRDGLSPEERVDTEPVLAYLLRHDRERGFAELSRLVRSDRGGSPFVAHNLAAQGPDGHAVLLALLEGALPGERLTFAQRLAVRLLFDQDPATAVDRLGGASFLASPAGRPRLAAMLDWIRDDTWRIKKGWLAADPRIAELCAGLKGDADKPLAALAGDLIRTLPPALRPKSPRVARKVPPEQEAPDPLIVEELGAIRATFERLVAHLKATGYRFAAPRKTLVAPSAADLKAVARLEKKARVPTALAAFWRTVGSVDLRGWHPDWPLASYLAFPGAEEPVWLTDPLVVGPAVAVIGQALEENGEPPFALHIAPDSTGKAGYSGGLLTLWVPQDGADPVIDGTEETFLSHLRRSMAWAGFRGFESIADRPEGWLAAARAAGAR
jgi:hypothetical protein